MKYTRIKISFIGLFFVFTSCVNVRTTISNNEVSPSNREYSEQAVLWQQNAGEYRALCYQAYNTAKFRLDLALSNPELKGKKLAVVTDMDETVIDNSPYNAKLVLTDEEYTKEEWINWGNKRKALAVPGATNFLNYAKEKGVEIFYISNRFDEQFDATLDNMKLLNFPYPDKEHVFLMKETSNKQPRFDEVAKTHEIVLFMGDNLTDFTSKFRLNTTAERNALTDLLQADFGVKFIVLPNPMYGDWETKGIYQGQKDLTKDAQRKMRKEALRTY